MTLETILAPLTPAVFLEECYGKKFHLISGQRGKFSSLFDWNVLNAILRRHDLTSRFHLVKDGAAIPRESVLERDKQGLSSTRLNEKLREGATLVIDHVHRMHEPISQLVQEIGRTLECVVGTNTYAGWKTVNGFDLHRDDRDTFILQIAGQKRWRIYGETERFSLGRGRAGAPAGDPIWEGMLTEGDALYMPRGWWHVAFPCDEPTLHLTIGCYKPNGIHIMQWLAERLASQEFMRMDVPRRVDRDNHAAYHAGLKRLILEACTDPSFLGDYYDYLELDAVPRPEFTLPRIESVLRLNHPTVLIWQVPRSLQLTPAQPIEVHFDLNTYTFPEATAPLFQRLQGKAIPLDTFFQEFEEVFGRDSLEVFLNNLLRAGIISQRELPAAIPS